MSDARYGHARVAIASCACFLRGLPLFVKAHPRTPLRAFGIIALDLLHVLRRGRPLSRTRVDTLAMFFDFEGLANAAWDRKRFCSHDYRAMRRRLRELGLGPYVRHHLARLRVLERRRPQVGSGFEQVRAYREEVARLSISAAAALAFADHAPEPRIGRPAEDGYDRDEDTLFRILMQCQIIDDVIDCREDAASGLPGFMTAMTSQPHALALTSRAVREYGPRHRATGISRLFPFRLTLHLFTGMATLVVRFAWGGVAGAPIAQPEWTERE